MRFKTNHFCVRRNCNTMISLLFCYIGREFNFKASSSNKSSSIHHFNNFNTLFQNICNQWQISYAINWRGIIYTNTCVANTFKPRDKVTSNVTINAFNIAICHVFGWIISVWCVCLIAFTNYKTRFGCLSYQTLNLLVGNWVSISMIQYLNLGC